MRLVLDPAEEAAHGHWLRRTPGAYEWWYFDARSDDGRWALACIWFLGNPFSPYYAQAARGQAGDPFRENALFFALYKDGALHAYHFTSFANGAWAAETLPGELRFGPNVLGLTNGRWQMTLADENGNGRRLNAALSFTAPPLVSIAVPVKTAPPDDGGGLDGDHAWLPAAPVCRVLGTITLREEHNPGAETITFTGTGYHDHNWGRLPFGAAIRAGK